MECGNWESTEGGRENSEERLWLSVAEKTAAEPKAGQMRLERNMRGLFLFISVLAVLHPIRTADAVTKQ